MLPLSRIAIAKPPDGWFYGITQAFFAIYRQALVDLGLAVIDVPVDAFLPPDAGRISGVLADLRAFRPQLAIGVDGSHALLCRMQARRNGYRPNVFTDILDIPTICPWDHAPAQIAAQLLQPPRDPADSTGGALAALRAVLTHPRMIHWSCDSGQAKIMKDLGFVLPGRLVEDVPPTLPGFFAPVRGAVDESVGFVGHFAQEESEPPLPALARLTERVIECWASGFDRSIWDALASHISRLPEEMRRSLALDHDQSHFWQFAYSLIDRHARRIFRLKMLGAAGVPVVCYGDLRMDRPGVPANLTPAPRVSFGPELAAIFARHAIMIDVVSPGFVNGYSEKQLHAFSCGGFMLMNRKQDFVNAFGQAGEEVSYVDAADLACKVDRFLTNPRYRREVGNVIREKIAADFRVEDVLRRVLEGGYHCAEAAGQSSRSTMPFHENGRVTKVMDLLPQLRSEPHWVGASVHHGELGARVLTPPQAWLYAASIGIPPTVRAMNEPHLRVRLRVESGRIGLAAMRDDTQTFLTEQSVSPCSDAVTLTVELPRHGVSTVILRNTVETATRALVLEASLCDRIGAC